MQVEKIFSAAGLAGGGNRDCVNGASEQESGASASQAKDELSGVWKRVQSQVFAGLYNYSPVSSYQLVAQSLHNQPEIMEYQ